MPCVRGANPGVNAEGREAAEAEEEQEGGLERDEGIGGGHEEEEEDREDIFSRESVRCMLVLPLLLL